MKFRTKSYWHEILDSNIQIPSPKQELPQFSYRYLKELFLLRRKLHSPYTSTNEYRQPKIRIGNTKSSIMFQDRNTLH